MARNEGIYNLFLSIPRALMGKLSQKYKYSIDENIEIIVLYGEEVEAVRRQVEALGATFENLGYGFGIITIKFSELEKIGSIKEIQYIELPKNLYYNSETTNRASCITDVRSTYGLSGNGVLVGFIDSGIDFMHQAFRNEEGLSRIDYIYDLQLKQVYNKAQIDEAIKSPNPYNIVPHQDRVGHGTHVAGVACAGGKIPTKYYGVAPESSIAMVKLTGEATGGFTKSSQVMRGIKFLVDKSKELNKPLVINLSFSTNDGAHDGRSLFEKYISTVCTLERITFCVAAGNEGNKGHHARELIEGESKEISFNVDKGEVGIILRIYKRFLTDISISIRSPDGSITPRIDLTRGFVEGNLRGTYYYVYYTGPLPFNISGEILVTLVAQGNELLEGVWSLVVYRESDEITDIDIWLPISEALNDKTRFTRPTVFNTVGIPGTVEDVITVGSYNSAIGDISPFSGRGREGAEIVKPSLVAPGIDVEGPIPGGGFDALTGTSVAAPSVSGAAALLMEWGFVKGRDPYLYGQRLKYYLLKGARVVRKTEVYPNATWGYGTLCLRNALEIWLNEEPLRGGIMKKNNREINPNENLINNLSKNIKDEIPDKLFKCEKLYNQLDYDIFLVEYSGDIEAEFKNIPNACIFVLTPSYAILIVELEKADEVLDRSKTITHVEPNNLYTLATISPLEVANINTFHTNEFLSLKGTGVIVGIIDTGIDYLNEEFMTEDGKTRIVAIWDQEDQSGTAPEGFYYGSEYTREQIDRAIQASKNGEDPYKIVPEKDQVGHGTEVAGIVGARGKNGVLGAAPDCEFLIVKTLRSDENTLAENAVFDKGDNIYSSTSIALSIKYLLDFHEKVDAPLVICIPMESNAGAHDGTTVVERFIDRYATDRGVITVAGTGNQGDTETHASGKLAKTGDISNVELQVGPNQKGISVFIWGTSPDKLSIGITSPSGESISKIPVKLQTLDEIRFVYEKTRVTIEYFVAETSSGNEFILVRMFDVSPGIWQFRIIGDFIINGNYDLWIYQRALLDPETKFLNPDPYTTITSPGNGNNIITTAYYNQEKGTLIASSGRGFTRDGRIKPELCIGGFEVLTTTVGGGTKIVTGSSAATAVLAGAVALILEWGIVKRNDVYMYTPKVKTYLIRGTKQIPQVIYPNREVGYGVLDFRQVFENMRSIKDSNLFFSIPSEFEEFLVPESVNKENKNE
ncbi:S8 family peptidase [Clostridium senegalense]|uniref:S8 family peptidase n=1 Tax=Clostridium senegalense TaxID=1465809 RepID=UPI000288289C|nr:S8 family peptidase [Clostridium senegalense]